MRADVCGCESFAEACGKNYVNPELEIAASHSTVNGGDRFLRVFAQIEIGNEDVEESEPKCRLGRTAFEKMVRIFARESLS